MKIRILFIETCETISNTKWNFHQDETYAIVSVWSAFAPSSLVPCLWCHWIRRIPRFFLPSINSTTSATLCVVGTTFSSGEPEVLVFKHGSLDFFCDGVSSTSDLWWALGVFSLFCYRHKESGIYQGVCIRDHFWIFIMRLYIFIFFFLYPPPPFFCTFCPFMILYSVNPTLNFDYKTLFIFSVPYVTKLYHRIFVLFALLSHTHAPAPTDFVWCYLRSFCN